MLKLRSRTCGRSIYRTAKALGWLGQLKHPRGPRHLQKGNFEEEFLYLHEASGSSFNQILEIPGKLTAGIQNGGGWKMTFRLKNWIILGSSRERLPGCNTV